VVFHGEFDRVRQQVQVDLLHLDWVEPVFALLHALVLSHLDRDLLLYDSWFQHQIYFPDDVVDAANFIIWPSHVRLLARAAALLAPGRLATLDEVLGGEHDHSEAAHDAHELSPDLGAHLE